MEKIKLKRLSRLIKEGKDQDNDPKAVYYASEIDMLDKAEDNITDVSKDEPKKPNTQNIDKTKKDLENKYKAITGHTDIKKSIPESKIYHTVKIFEGMLEDLGIKDFKDFGQEYKEQIKQLVDEIGGSYIGYCYDVPTKTIEVITDKGKGNFYFYPEDNTFERYQIQNFYQ